MMMAKVYRHCRRIPPGGIFCGEGPQLVVHSFYFAGPQLQLLHSSNQDISKDYLVGFNPAY
jgi:hypothetical protein